MATTIVGPIGTTSSHNFKHLVKSRSRSNTIGIPPTPCAPIRLGANQMAPLGSRAVVYVDAKSHTSWDTRGLDAWYCSHDPNHYQGKNSMLSTHACTVYWHCTTSTPNTVSAPISHRKNMTSKCTMSWSRQSSDCRRQRSKNFCKQLRTPSR